MSRFFPTNLGAAGYIIILQIVIIGFFGLLFVGSQLQSIDIKQIALQNQETTNDTNEIIKSGINFNKLLTEIRNISVTAEESRQNQTRVFLPALQNSFDNVERIINITQELRLLVPSITNSVNNVTNATMFLAQNFGPDTGYLERENFQYGQANQTFEIAQQIKETLREINDTLSGP